MVFSLRLILTGTKCPHKDSEYGSLGEPTFGSILRCTCRKHSRVRDKMKKTEIAFLTYDQVHFPSMINL